VHTPAALAHAVAAQTNEAAATAAGLLFRDLTIDFPLNISIVRSTPTRANPAQQSSRDQHRRSDSHLACDHPLGFAPKRYERAPVRRRHSGRSV
jgi:hypothetical protein